MLGRFAPLPTVLLTLFITGTTNSGAEEASQRDAANPATETKIALQDEVLSFDDRVRCRRAVEEVYWRHRVWPTVNPGPKPALDELLPEAQLHKRVETDLQKGSALDVLWRRPLTSAQLQAELNRMARETKRPDLLRELFAVLDDDPFLAAECLARPVLTDRLTRSWYARDERFHGTQRKQVEAAMTGIQGDAERISELGGEYFESEYRRIEEGERPPDLGTEFEVDSALEVGIEEWRARVTRLATRFGLHTGTGDAVPISALLERIPLRTFSELTEEDSRFGLVTVLSREPDRLRIASQVWRKRPFDTWWEETGRNSVEPFVTLTAVQPPAGGYVLPTPRDAGCSADSWEALPAPPRSRSGHTAVWTGTEMIVWGGASDVGYLNTGGRFDPATATWSPTSMEGDVPTPRFAHSAVWTGTEMIIWGGNDPAPSSPGTGGRYDPTADSWAAMSMAPWRMQHTAIWTGSEMIVWGGLGNGYLNTGDRYDPETDSWTPTWNGAGTPAARRFHTAVWSGSEMIVWGGTDGSYLTTGGRYEPETDEWSPTSTGSDVPLGRQKHTAVWTGEEMIVWGGSGVGLHRSGGRYDPASDHWFATSTELGTPSPRDRHTAVWTGVEMIIWGGAGSLETDVGGRYDPVSDSWLLTASAGGVPQERYDHTAVWTGTEMIVWGGFDDGFLNTGGRYDPSSDSWTGTAPGFIPARRARHTSVWTGTEMIVWGGAEGVPYPYLHDGGRYDPATENWTAVATGAEAPNGYVSHSAVWTGTEMIVWGGFYDTADTENDGSRYNPVTDSWTPISSGADVVARRGDHSAVWTGTEMIVWGGGFYNWNTGGRYDPVSDSWTATPTGAGVPTGRRFHNAVWTGTEMIVWGGSEPDRTNSGGRFNPAANVWTPTSMETGVPVARSNFSAIWTGTEMIVWGGYGNESGEFDGYLSSGGRYDPVNDVWSTPPNQVSAPQGRSGPAAIWTGTEMIVWGGYRPEENPTGRGVGTGGRYDPVTDSWTATSMGSGVPIPRYKHTGVWTGNEFFIWGGKDYSEVGNRFFDSGARYCACDGGAVGNWYPDADGDGLGAMTSGVLSCEQPPGYVAAAGDCDDRYATCTTDCTDADWDGMPACAPDCDESNPNCTTDCTDLDADGFCVTTDCDDHYATCTTDCTDADSDGMPACAPDCDESNPNCTTDCTDLDADGFCVTTDCDDQVASCTNDCSDPDEDLTPDCRDNCPGLYNPAQTDADTDGFGDGDGCDCDDSNAATYPDAHEINDGLDNQCPGDSGYGLIDEISGHIRFDWWHPRLLWPEQPGATRYEVVRSNGWEFVDRCERHETEQTFWVDHELPAAGIRFYYLVRSTQPLVGSWGADSEGAERTTICP